MSDSARIWVDIRIHDQWMLPGEEPERWKMTKDEIEQVIQKALTKNGFGLDEYDVTVGGD